MEKTTYQLPEIRDASDNIIQSGTYGKKTAFANATNNGVLDYINNNLEWLKTQTDANTTDLGKYLPLAGGTLTGDVIIDETTDRAIKGSASNVGLLCNSAAWALRDFGNGLSPIYYNKSSKQLMFPAGYRVGGTVTDSTGAVTNGNTTLQVNATDVTIKNGISDPKITLGTGGASQSISSNGAVIKTGPLDAQSYSNIKTIQRGTAYSKGDIVLSRKIAGYLYAECTTAGTTAALSGPTFIRASVAYDDDGNQVAANVPRFTDEGLMIEEGTTNLMTNSSFETDLANWVSQTLTMERDTTVGRTDKTSMHLVSGSSNNRVLITLNVKAGQQFAFSAYVKTGSTGTHVHIEYSGGDYVWEVFGESNKSSGSNDWERLFCTSDVATSDTVAYFFIDVKGEAWIDDVQMEAKSYATSYAVDGATRAAEILTAPASVINTTAHTYHTTFLPSRSSGTNAQYLLDGGGADGSNIALYIDTSGKLNLIAGAVALAGTTALTVASHKIGYALGSGGVALYVDGTPVASSATVPSITLGDKIYIGSKADGTLQADGRMSDIRISNTTHTSDQMLSDASLASLPQTSDTTFLMPLNGDLSYLPALDPATVEPTYPTTANTAVTDGTAVFTLRDIRKPPNAVTDISYASGALTLTMGDGTTKTVSLS